MDIPIYSSPGIISELTGTFRSCFGEIRQFRHFEELVSSFQTSQRRSVAHLNSTIIAHVNQSSMNRFLSSRIDTDLMFMKTVENINSVENDGILAIDDTIAEKSGKNIEAAGWIFDHSIGRTVWGIQFATCVLSGRYGIYPISAEVYRRKESLDNGNEYRSKIDIQKGVIEKCLIAGLNFSTVTGDAWYFTKDIISFLNGKKLNWVFQSKGNRKVRIRGRWTTLDSIFLPYSKSQTIKLSGNTYSVWEVKGKIKGMGEVKVIISEGINGKRYYATNRSEWNMKRIMETYLRRWDIEVMHRDIKQDGLGHIFLRKLCKTELYLRLMVTGRAILEIAAIMSLQKYPGIPDRIGKRKRWIGFEFLESLLDGFSKYGDRFVMAVKQSMLNPYKSARNVLKFRDKLNHGVAI